MTEEKKRELKESFIAPMSQLADVVIDSFENMFDKIPADNPQFAKVLEDTMINSFSSVLERGLEEAKAQIHKPENMATIQKDVEAVMKKMASAVSPSPDVIAELRRVQNGGK